MVEKLVAQGSFDAATDLANHLPVSVVSNLVGLPEKGRERMLVWAEEMFNCFGPMNDRTVASFPVLEEMMDYATNEAVPAKLKPGSWAQGIHDAVARGEVPAQACPAMMIDYLGPSLDTTIFAISNAVWAFANNPDQWDLVRSDPQLMPSAVNEVLRYDAPIQASPATWPATWTWTAWCCRRARAPSCSTGPPTATSASIPTRIGSMCCGAQAIIWVSVPGRTPASA